METPSSNEKVPILRPMCDSIYIIHKNITTHLLTNFTEPEFMTIFEMVENKPMVMFRARNDCFSSISPAGMCFVLCINV